MIKSYRDLIIYQNSYKAMAIVLKEIIPRLPREEKYDLVDQMRRCAKAIPALIAEGFAKRYQKKYWDKYLVDATGEINEMQHHPDVCMDIYENYVDKERCNEAKEIYTITSKQTYKLRKSWRDFHDNHQ